MFSFLEFEIQGMNIVKSRLNRLVGDDDAGPSNAESRARNRRR